MIEKLGELRDGRARPEPARRGEDAPPTRSMTANGPSAVASAKADERGETKPTSQSAEVTARGYGKTRIEEKATTVDFEKIWQAVLARIPTQKGCCAKLSFSGPCSWSRRTQFYTWFRAWR